jgi:hypothetical protein
LLRAARKHGILEKWNNGIMEYRERISNCKVQNAKCKMNYWKIIVLQCCCVAVKKKHRAKGTEDRVKKSVAGYRKGKQVGDVLKLFKKSEGEPRGRNKGLNPILIKTS